MEHIDLALANFDVVVRHRGGGQSSRTAGRPQATLSRRVVALEANQDLRLFERGASVLRMTSKGEAFLKRTRPLNITNYPADLLGAFRDLLEDAYEQP